MLSSTPLHPKTWFNKKKPPFSTPQITPNHSNISKGSCPHISNPHISTARHPQQGPPCFCQSPHSVPLLGLQVKPTRSQRSTSVAFSFLGGFPWWKWDAVKMFTAKISTSIDPIMERYDPKKLEVRTPMLEIFTGKKRKNIHNIPLGESKCARHIKFVKCWNRFCWGDMFFFQGLLPEVVYVFEEPPINSWETRGLILVVVSLFCGWEGHFLTIPSHGTRLYETNLNQPPGGKLTSP